MDSSLLSNNIGLIAKYTLENNNYDLIAGIRAERQAFNRKDNQSYDDWTGNWQYMQNPFLQLETRLKGVTLTAGCGLSTFYQNGRTASIYHVEPSLGIFYENLRHAQYNLAFSNNVNYPALHELFSSSSGNPDVKEESAWKYEASTLQPFDSGSISITAFYNQIDNMVEKADDIYQNIEQVNSYGFEAVFKWKFITEHSIEYRYLDYTEDSDRPLNENPKNIVTITEKAKLPWNVKLDYNVTWHDNSTSWQNVAADDKYILSSYWLHNAYLSKSISRFKCKLGIENILDQNYEDKYGYPQPGIDFVFSCEASI